MIVSFKASDNNVLTITVLLSKAASLKMSLAAVIVATGISSSNCVSNPSISRTLSPSTSNAIVSATLANPESSSFQLSISSTLTPKSVNGCLKKYLIKLLSFATVEAALIVAILITFISDKSSITKYPSASVSVDPTLWNAFNSFDQLSILFNVSASIVSCNATIANFSIKIESSALSFNDATTSI